MSGLLMDELIKERMIRKIEDINTFFAELDAILKEDSELLKPGSLHGSSMLLFSIINAAIDIADDIKFSKKLGASNKYIEIFSSLKDNKLISEDIFDEFVFLIHNRNMLAHEYGNINKADIKKILNRIPAVYEIIALAKELIKQTK